MTTTPVESLWDINQTAAYLNVAVGTLRHWRHRGTGPKSLKVGAQNVRYRPEDVRQYLAEQEAREAGRGAR